MMERPSRPLKTASIELGRASLAARQGRVEELDVARLAELVDAELRKLVLARREAVLGGLSRRMSLALGALESIESGQTTHDAATLAAELASIASGLRILGQVAASTRAA
jgi:hypothetical protein